MWKLTVSVPGVLPASANKSKKSQGVLSLLFLSEWELFEAERAQLEAEMAVPLKV